MNGHRAYQHYLALKKHFNEDKYSVFDKPRVPVPEATFIKRNDRYLWEKFAGSFTNVPDMMIYMVANFAKGNDGFLYNLEESQGYFLAWQKTSQSITHNLESELSDLVESARTHKLTLESLLSFRGPSPPPLLNFYLGSRISIQSMVILNSYLNYVDDWKGSMSFLFEAEIRRIDKSQRFIKFNKERVQKVIESFTDDLQIVV